MESINQKEFLEEYNRLLKKHLYGSLKTILKRYERFLKEHKRIHREMFSKGCTPEEISIAKLKALKNLSPVYSTADLWSYYNIWRGAKYFVTYLLSTILSLKNSQAKFNKNPYNQHQLVWDNKYMLPKLYTELEIELNTANLKTITNDTTHK